MKYGLSLNALANIDIFNSPEKKIIMLNIIYFTIYLFCFQFDAIPVFAIARHKAKHTSFSFYLFLEHSWFEAHYIKITFEVKIYINFFVPYALSSMTVTLNDQNIIINIFFQSLGMFSFLGKIYKYTCNYSRLLDTV